MKLSNTGVIFDMDGVLVVNMHIHEQAFYEFGRRYGKEITREFFLKNITGSTNELIMPRIFGNLNKEEIIRLSDEKEQLYRDLYSPHLKLADGLEGFLEYLKVKKIPMAIASNAPPENITFILEKLSLDKYITIALNVTSVSNPKPAPDMFLKAAELLGIDPDKCIVFEEAPGGIKAAYAANMKAISVLTSHQKEEFEKADLFIEDFNDINLHVFFERNLELGMNLKKG